MAKHKEAITVSLSGHPQVQLHFVQSSASRVLVLITFLSTTFRLGFLELNRVRNYGQIG